MGMKKVLSLICILISFHSYADDDKYKICFINGYYSGEDDKFMMGLATHIVVREKLYTDPMCTAAHRVAYDVGVKFSTTGKYDSEQEMKITGYAADFREGVNKAIVDLIEY